MIDNLLEINSVLSLLIKVLLVILLAIGVYLSVKFSNKRLDENDKIHFDKIVVLRYLLYVSIIVILISLFKKYAILRVTTITLIVSIVISYILNPLVNFFERKKIKRIFAILLVYLIIILGFGILILGILPSTINQFKNLIISLPDIVKNFIAFTDEIREGMFNSYPSINEWLSGFNTQILDLVNAIASNAFNTATNVLLKMSNIFSIIIQLILIPVFSFYLLLEKDKILKIVKEKSPNRYREFLISLWKEIDESLSMFVRGRIIMAIFVGIATTIYLAVFGIEFALVIGIITCIADIIPYIGPFLGFVPAVLLAFFKSPITAVWVGILFAIVQWIENNILGPKILGDSTGMHPLIILILLILGGGMFGVAGMIFSVPVAAVIKIVYNNTKPYIIKYLYRDKI